MRNFFAILVTLLLMGVSSSCTIEIGGDRDDSDFEGAGEKGVFQFRKLSESSFHPGFCSTIQVRRSGGWPPRNWRF